VLVATQFATKEGNVHGDFGVAKEQTIMSKTYAIADLHGRFDLLELALACIAERAEPLATLVTLGDYVDRGPDSRKIIERLMAGLERDGWRLICLKGNHEDIMWQTCRRLPDVDWWLTNGGGATRQDQFVSSANRLAVPMISYWRDFAAAGGLMSYGTSLTDALRLIGTYTGRILKGEKPSDLPVQESVKIDFVINLRTAKVLGLNVPATLLARADEVIE